MMLCILTILDRFEEQSILITNMQHKLDEYRKREASRQDKKKEKAEDKIRKKYLSDYATASAASGQVPNIKLHVHNPPQNAVAPQQQPQIHIIEKDRAHSGASIDTKQYLELLHDVCASQFKRRIIVVV